MRRAEVGALILLFLGLALVGIFLRPLSEPSEARYAEAAREMLASGDWLLPQQSGLPYPDKPPGALWLMAGSMALFGAHVWAARLSSFLALAGVVALLWRSHEKQGPQAALIAASSPSFLALGQIATLDMVLTFFLSAGILGGRRWVGAGERRAALLAGAALAAAVLVKGPLVGMLLPFGILLTGALLEGRSSPLRRLVSPWLWLPCLGLAAPWFVAVLHHAPEIGGWWVEQELHRRLLGGELGRVHGLGYLPGLALLAVLPWAIGLLPAFRSRATRRPVRPSEDRSAASASLCKEAVFHRVWAFLPIVLFSLPASKQPGYLAPAIPGLALCLAGIWSDARLRVTGLRLAGAWWLLLAGTSLVFASPERTRSDDPVAHALEAGGAERWLGAQILGWSYGLSFRLGRTDLPCLGSRPKAWSFAWTQGVAPRPGSRAQAWRRAARLLGGPEPAFVLVHDLRGHGARLAFWEQRMNETGRPVWRWCASPRNVLVANRPPPPLLADPASPRRPVP